MLGGRPPRGHPAVRQLGHEPALGLAAADRVLHRRVQGGGRRELHGAARRRQLRGGALVPQRDQGVLGRRAAGRGRRRRRRQLRRGAAERVRGHHPRLERRPDPRRAARPRRPQLQLRRGPQDRRPEDRAARRERQCRRDRREHRRRYR